MRNVLSFKGTKNKSELSRIRLLSTLYFVFSDIDPQICNYLRETVGALTVLSGSFAFSWPISLWGWRAGVCVFPLECQKKKSAKSPREMKLFLFEADTSA